MAITGIAAAVVLVAAGAPSAAAAPAATLTPTTKCWLQVVNDWLQHNSQIKGTYAIPCYTQAIQNLNKYPDIRQYSNAIDDIQRALLAAVHEERGGPGNGPSSGGGSIGGPGAGPTGSGGPRTPTGTGGGGGGGSSPVQSVFHPSDAQSIPLPLIVLAGLAALLLLAGAGIWIAKRVQARRMTAAPAQQR